MAASNGDTNIGATECVSEAIVIFPYTLAPLRGGEVFAHTILRLPAHRASIITGAYPSENASWGRHPKDVVC